MDSPKIVCDCVVVIIFMNVLHNRFLVEHGADIAAVNNEGELPLDLAEDDDEEMTEYLQDQLRKASE